jgi:signal transduction histidine kinase
VGAPITVDGRLWGAMTAGTSHDEPMPPGTESRLAQFTDLIATAIANAESGARADRLTAEQTALRRVAMLVAGDASPAEVFAKVTEELATVLGDAECSLFRAEGDGAAAVVAVSGAIGVQAGTRWPVDGTGAVATVLREGRPFRIDEDATDAGAVAQRDRGVAIRSGVACPIVVGGRVWGVIGAARYHPVPFAPDTETRIARFAELAATAIANAEARGEVRRLAEEQAALRRVATLVAERDPPSAVLDAVAAEMQALLDADQVALNRFETGEEIRVLAHRGLDVSRTPVGSRVSTTGESVTAIVRRTGRPARMEGYEHAEGALAELARATGLRYSVSAPIAVEGRVWGLITASWKGEQSLPADTEERMTEFGYLVATAIADAEARAEVQRLVAEQAALRRVATLVAQGAPASVVLDAVAGEMEGLLDADGVTVSRYEPGETVMVLAQRGSDTRKLPPGTQVSHQGENVTSIVRRSMRSARIEHRAAAEGAIAELVRTVGVRVSVGAPIVVEGRLWGVATATWRGEVPPPADTEDRMARFSELLDTAIANADSRDQLNASRARLVTEADEARRRLVRDLHDGAQQRLVHTIVTLKLAQQALRTPDGSAESLVGEALGHAERGNQELRELAHGILPEALTRGGLRAGVDAVVRRMDLPVQVHLPAERFPAEIEASAYFIVAEALTNVVKHSHAEHAEVGASVQNGTLRVEVRDDGIGGADSHGHGLVGMDDRVTALGGRLTVDSPSGGGTVVAATLPLSAD